MITLGLIGFGYWGPNYARVISGMKQAKLKWICDLDNKLLLKAKRLYPQIRLTKDYHKLLQDTEVDAVIIATPVTTHYQLAKESLINNKHILVEKPLTDSYKTAKELQELSQKYNKVLLVGHIYLFHPAVKFLKQYIDKGNLGEILFITSQRTNLGPIRDDVNAAWDLASHDISTIQYLLKQKITAISANGQGFINKNNEDLVNINLQYAKSIFANIFVSWLSPVKIRQMIIAGDKCIAVFDDLNTKHMIRIIDQQLFPYQRGQTIKYQLFKNYFNNRQKIYYPEIPLQEPLQNEIQYFIDLVRYKTRSNKFDKHQLEVVKILEAVQKSLSEKRFQIFIKAGL